MILTKPIITRRAQQQPLVAQPQKKNVILWKKRVLLDTHELTGACRWIVPFTGEFNDERMQAALDAFSKKPDCGCGTLFVEKQLDANHLIIQDL